MSVLRKWLAAIPRWAWIGAIAVGALVVLIVVFWPFADLIAEHDVGTLAGRQRDIQLQAARDAARGRMIQVGGGLFVVLALTYTARNFGLAQQGHVTDRYTKAIEQLGSENLDVRIGGIYALERVARDSLQDHPTVIEVLTTFVRERSREAWSPPESSGERSALRGTRADVQTALTVIGRRDPAKDGGGGWIDLSGARLQRAVLVRARLGGADLSDVDLSGARLEYAYLSIATLSRVIGNDANLFGAYLKGASLSGSVFAEADFGAARLNYADLDGVVPVLASFTGADLTDASMGSADMSGAIFWDATLVGAGLAGAALTDAKLKRADFTSADLTSADLTSADLTSADLTDVKLSSADLTEAIVTDVTWTGADLSGAIVSADMPAPEGWTRDPGSGRLTRTAPNPGGEKRDPT